MRSAAEAAPSHLYVPGLSNAGERLELPDDESRYLRRVCRARVGDRATATDGAGLVAKVRVASLGARVQATVESTWRVPRVHEARVLCGAPEGQRADWLVEKLAELGVSGLVPIDGDLGRWECRPERWERFGRLAVAALRQSRRAWVMEVRATSGLTEAVDRLPPSARCWIASVEGQSAAAMAHGWTDEGRGNPTLEVVAVGPSAGFSEKEIALLVGRGFSPIRLADARLRTETAALAWAANWAIRVPPAAA